MAPVVCIEDIPKEDCIEFKSTSFFRRRAVRSLPLPADVRARALERHGAEEGEPRPPPVPYPELGLLVKWGSGVSIAEGQCWWFFNHHLKDEVPTPEVFGWRLDGDEVFIYMQLIQGITLEESWPSLSKQERKSICLQLCSYITAWRRLKQPSEPYTISNIVDQGLGDIIFADIGLPYSGSFSNLKAFNDFFAKLTSRGNPDRNPRLDVEYLAGMSDDRPVVFTHADLSFRNIIVSKRTFLARPKIIAVIDWHQSGWTGNG